MKIIIPTFERIEWMPPTITMLKELDKMGYDILVITIFPSKYLEDIGLRHVRQLSLSSKERSLQEKVKYVKGISGILFRIDNLYKKIIARRLKVVLRNCYNNGDLLWVVNEMTVILGGIGFLIDYDYYFTIYELHESNYKNRNIVWAARQAKKVIVPEYCRAHIMKFWYGLEQLPTIIPNKSDIILGSDNDYKPVGFQDAVQKIEILKKSGKFILLYMGIISHERPLDAILRAISEHNVYHLVILGRETAYLHELETKYPSSISFLGHFVPPFHLQIGKLADVGILVYTTTTKDLGLNALFCAPNKIWEYSGLGLPVLSNDIPGLRFDVKYSGIGCCIDFNNPLEIIEALNDLRNNRDNYSKAAIAYYNSLNIPHLYKNLINVEQNGKTI